MNVNFRASAWILSLFIVGCKANTDNNKKQEPDEIPVVQLANSDTTIYTGYVADIQAIQNVEIRAKVNGFLEQILVDEGSHVKKGQPLFLINVAEYTNAVAKTEAQLSNAHAEAHAAELEVSRVRILTEKNVVSPSDLKLAEARLMAAQAKVKEALSAHDLANLQLSYTAIKAPFDGIVNRIPLKRGSLIDAGTLLTTISDNRSVYAYFNVSEIEYLQLTKGTRASYTENDAVSLVLADGSAYAHKGRIETIEGEFDESTGSIAFRATFPNPERILKHGASGRVRLSNAANDIVMVPQKAVFEIQDKHFVYVLDKNNQIRQRSFLPSRRIAESYIVASGLNAGDTIVYEGIQNLRDGMTIKPLFTTVKK
ncbi:efflux RND transporter periplasmic adaptor subunit [Flavihumibacter stibioxidans]|uniref:Efflux transporter periplasmic adaptor subunit n=1 Tax=Flavihumibacter stibioxidans TaxID=1834163 RepID=A0ABR7M3Z9_9BACT|nr:efflux RND transporter periplasmic adaptor subunit [Flavihumibacter stibioxidans]MBC6489750.1 efflux transporter periplasmic adaptor subunit [Flavihumibacter stibioxidans]